MALVSFASQIGRHQRRDSLPLVAPIDMKIAVANHLPKSSMYFGLVDRSPGPSTQPTRSPARSKTETGLLIDDTLGPSKNCSSAARTRLDLLSLRCLAARSSRAARAAEIFSERVFMS